MRLSKGIFVGAGLCVLAMAASPRVAAASAPHGGGHVYVNDNTAGTNTVAAFIRHADGSLTPMAGSPFQAGGAGTGTVTGSQGSLQVTADGRYLLVADAGSNQISVLRIHPDGTLRPVDGSPVSSGGIKPVSIAVHGNLVYVANGGDGTNGTNYTGFFLDGGGQLTPIGGATVALPSSANPGDNLFNSTGANLIGIEVGTTDPSTFLIDSFDVGHDGRLVAAAGSPFPAQAAGPFGSEFSLRLRKTEIPSRRMVFSSQARHSMTSCNPLPARMCRAPKMSTRLVYKGHSHTRSQARPRRVATPPEISCSSWLTPRLSRPETLRS